MLERRITLSAIIIGWIIVGKIEKNSGQNFELWKVQIESLLIKQDLQPTLLGKTKGQRKMRRRCCSWLQLHPSCFVSRSFLLLYLVSSLARLTTALVASGQIERNLQITTLVAPLPQDRCTPTGFQCGQANQNHDKVSLFGPGGSELAPPTAHQRRVIIISSKPNSSPQIQQTMYADV